MTYHRKLLIDWAATPPPETPKRRRFASYLEAPNLSPKTCLLCEILATTTISSIERALDDFGMRALSPADVKSVLKLSYAHTGPAVAFFRWGIPLLPRPHHHSPYSWNLVVDLLDSEDEGGGEDGDAGLELKEMFVGVGVAGGEERKMGVAGGGEEEGMEHAVAVHKVGFHLTTDFPIREPLPPNSWATMASPSKTSDRQRRRPSKGDSDTDDAKVPSLTLWVGHLSPSITDGDLAEIFKKYNALDCTTMHPGRSYAFVYFSNAEDAAAAKKALQGTRVRGSAINIEFARPAKSGKHLWVGGISSSVTKEQLEDEFSKFGKIEECTLLRDRNSAFIDYYKMDDAIAAQKNMNGKDLAGDQIRVDFQRSQPLRMVCMLNADDCYDNSDPRDGNFSNRCSELLITPNIIRSYHNSSQHGSKRLASNGGRRDGQPTNVLWIGHLPSVYVDETMIHGAMILFGEIERITCFPTRNYAFVEFRSVDEARRAKEGLQGRLFGDPRIQILFSSSDLAHHKDNAPLLPGSGGPGHDKVLNVSPYGPIEIFGHGGAIAPDNFTGCLPSYDLPRTGSLAKPSGQGFGFLRESSEFNDSVRDFPGSDPYNSKTPTWRRPSPSAHGRLSPSPDVWVPYKPMPDKWDDFDPREPKRSRISGSLPPDDVYSNLTRVEGDDIRDSLGFPLSDRVAGCQIARGPLELPASSSGDHCWRGVIAKGGTPVCHARCVPIGEGINSPFPEVVNCSARTGLDMLTKHYAEAIGFDIVFFLPDSEEDFASFTEFLRYLGLKKRAGVAKFDDGTTLFLVPPSDFLTKVLKIPGPERLYGVVLKFPHQSVGMPPQNSQENMPSSSYYAIHTEEPTSRNHYNLVSQSEEQALKMDYIRCSHENSLNSVPNGIAKLLLGHNDEQRVTESTPTGYTSNHVASQQVEVSLTPQLIATLASLIPTKSQPSTNGPVQVPPSSTIVPNPYSASPMHNTSNALQRWIHEHQATSGTLEVPGHQPEQSVYQISNQTQFVSQFPAHSRTVLRFPEQSAVSEWFIPWFNSGSKQMLQVCKELRSTDEKVFLYLRYLEMNTNMAFNFRENYP
ncbi:hypothetical protein J5N97_020987 [Dioscorea zingiberensis]|uniref:RRM domain-containing protein n=1 Tax=Dioscorea zingiberensis TaxID=325984 RepID=A0A9D5CI89_9LILI|nr:hypothetical protein J5N97_020987 [Dioscorea zingiberensis]